ncbi:MAG TPA: hypothetical protein VLX09_06440 [Stellaceae bacterium]|nr:hypothetical protein [Stellaceae bacterium]
MTTPSLRFIATTVGIALLLAPIFTLGQPASGPPTREGNIYDFHEHQPTEADPSAATTNNVENEVNDLLKQTDELDRTFDSKEGRDSSRR